MDLAIYKESWASLFNGLTGPGNLKLHIPIFSDVCTIRRQSFKTVSAQFYSNTTTEELAYASHWLYGLRKPLAKRKWLMQAIDFMAYACHWLRGSGVINSALNVGRQNNGPAKKY